MWAWTWDLGQLGPAMMEYVTSNLRLHRSCFDRHRYLQLWLYSTLRVGYFDRLLLKIEVQNSRDEIRKQLNNNAMKRAVVCVDLQRLSKNDVKRRTDFQEK